MTKTTLTSKFPMGSKWILYNLSVYRVIDFCPRTSTWTVSRSWLWRLLYWLLLRIYPPKVWLDMEDNPMKVITEMQRRR